MAHEPDEASAAPVGKNPALGTLDARIDAARKAEDERLAQVHAQLPGAAPTGWYVASTMVGYPLGGIVIGFTLDKLFDTMPWVTIGLMFTAYAGGCIQVVRSFNSRAG